MHAASAFARCRKPRQRPPPLRQRHFRNQNRPSFLPANLQIEPDGKRRDIGQFGIIFQISRYFDAILRRAHFRQAVRVFGCLRQE